MSKAFTKDDDASDAPLVIPARAPLPAGVPNYVTPRGLASLRAELSRLEAERARVESSFDAPARAHDLAQLILRVAELGNRIAGAVPVDPSAQPRDEVRFGATVTVRSGDGTTRRYQIVGVDEADVKQGRVAFVAPLSRALLGKHVGDTAVVHTPRGDDEVEVVAIAYE